MVRLQEDAHHTEFLSPPSTMSVMINGVGKESNPLFAYVTPFGDQSRNTVDEVYGVPTHAVFLRSHNYHPCMRACGRFRSVVPSILGSFAPAGGIADVGIQMSFKNIDMFPIFIQHLGSSISLSLFLGFLVLTGVTEEGKERCIPPNMEDPRGRNNVGGAGDAALELGPMPSSPIDEAVVLGKPCFFMRDWAK